MKRRHFIQLAVGAANYWSYTAAHAQQAGLPVIGFLNSQSSVGSEQLRDGFVTGLKQAGFIEGINVKVEYRWAAGHYDQFSALGSDLINRGVAVIVAAYIPAVFAAKSLTSTIPIVFISGLDPVTSGIVTSLSHPTGNLTGITNYNVTLVAKRLEMMRHIVPQASGIALMVNPKTPAAQSMEVEAKRAEQALGARVIIVRAYSEDSINSGFASLIAENAGGLVLAGDSYFHSRFEQIAGLAAQHKLPVIYDRREDALAGGLLSYGTNDVDLYRQAGIYAAKILKGAKPEDLPVEEATKIELVVNLKTARTLGLDVPTSILLRADEVIE